MKIEFYLTNNGCVALLDEDAFLVEAQLENMHRNHDFKDNYILVDSKEKTVIVFMNSVDHIYVEK